MHTWPRSLLADSSPTSVSRTPTAYARRSTATRTATNWGSAARRSTPVHSAKRSGAVVDHAVEQSGSSLDGGHVGEARRRVDVDGRRTLLHEHAAVDDETRAGHVAGVVA